MDRISLVSKVEKKLIYFLQKNDKVKEANCRSPEEKTDMEFYSNNIYNNICWVLLRDGINHGNKWLHWKGMEGGGGGSRRKIKEFVMSSFAWSRFVSAFVPLFFCSVVLFFRLFVRYVCRIHIQPSRNALDHYFVSLFICLSLSNQFLR